MKIIHILKGKADPNTLNGVNKVVHNLATEQLKSGKSVEVWGITSNPNIIRHEHKYPLQLFPACKNRFRICLQMKEAIKKLPKNSIVHLHSVFLPELFAAGMVLRKSSIRYVLTPHGGYSPHSRKKNRFAKLLYMFLFEKRLLANVYKLHALGVSEVDDLTSLAPLKPIVLIPNGQDIDDVFFKPVKTIKPCEKPLFGFCGRLSMAQKGLDLLIKGYAKYRQERGRGELWIIGDGPDYSVLKELAIKNKVENSIMFLGKLFNDEKFTYISQMDIFVHTSRWDGIPMAVLEAAALSKPLLLSQATNMCDYVKKYNNGIALKKNTPNHIAKAMHEFSRIMADKKNHELGKNSQRLIKEVLNWENISRKIFSDLYQ